jgi:putative tryptophan/tyrosine transport system substrate-binding protein
VISRRLFLLNAGAFILADRTWATQSEKVWRIGYLSAYFPRDTGSAFKAFNDQLRTLGYIEGQNTALESRFAEGRFDALIPLAEELMQLKVDVIVAPQTPAARAARAVTKAIPIVFVVASDPVGSGLVASLPYPGGNVTGTTDMGIDVAAKRLELLKQVVPRLRRVATLGNPTDPLWEPVWKEAQVAARHKAADLCALDPQRAARMLVDRGFEPRYDVALEVLRELPYNRWRESNPEDTLRFYALRLRDAGMLKSTPNKIIAQGTDWRFLNELKKELKA